MMTYKLLSNQGERRVNEDSVGVARKDNLYCFILADGLGGHGGGDLASASVVKTIQDYFSKEGQFSADCLGKCIDLAQERLMELQERMNKENEMKTTIVVLIVSENQAIWGHVGDSRLYHIIKKKDLLDLGKKSDWERTKDHSVPQMLVDLGEITEDEIRHHEDRNRLVKVLGIEWEEPQYEIANPIDVTNRDCFLLCTDGFWELIDEKNMIKLLKKAPDVEKWVLKMEEHVNTAGKGTGMDNYSAIAVWM